MKTGGWERLRALLSLELGSPNAGERAAAKRQLDAALLRRGLTREELGVGSATATTAASCGASHSKICDGWEFDLLTEVARQRGCEMLLVDDAALIVGSETERSRVIFAVDGLVDLLRLSSATARDPEGFCLAAIEVIGVRMARGEAFGCSALVPAQALEVAQQWISREFLLESADPSRPYFGDAESIAKGRAFGRGVEIADGAHRV